MITDIKAALDQGRTILFADECLFSSKTSQKTAFSSRRNNIVVSQRLIEAKPVALVAAVSIENGMEQH